MKSFVKRSIALATALACTITMTGCGTMTGIPSHGGGKRFSIEQRLVDASIRSSLKSIDVTPLKGKRVALVFDMISDEGGGTLSGGRLNIFGGLTAGFLQSPVTSTTNQFQVFNLAENNTNYNNQGSSSSSTSAGTTYVVGNNTGTSSGTNTSNGTNNNTGSSTNTGTSSGTNTGTSSGTNTGTSSGTNTGTSGSTGNTTTTTGAVTTTQTDNGTGTSSGTNTGTSSGTNTGTSSGTNTNTSSGSGTNTNSGTSSGTGTNAGNSTSNSTGTQNSVNTTDTNSASSSQGGSNTNRQALTPTPSSSQQQTRGQERKASVTAQYNGLGEYQNISVPKSDATLLMGLVRQYLLLSGVVPTAADDPKADVVLYITVSVFGIVRSRFDAYAFNQETVIAETALEMTAFDRQGNVIMRPRNANKEAKYDENYFFWAGPFKTDEEVRSGKGLLVDFSDVDGSKATYETDTKRHRWEGNSK